MYEFIFELIAALKYLGVMLLMAVFSSEYVMPVIGYVASHGSISLVGAIAAGSAGSVLASFVVYILARKARKKDVHSFASKYGKWLGITRRRVTRADRWFNRHAAATVFWSRFVPGMRTAVVLPAGIQKMPVWSFMFWTALGSSISTAILAYLGYTALESLTRMRTLANNISFVGTICLLALVALYVRWYVRVRKRRT